MALSKVVIIRIDPYHKVYGQLLPQVLQRLIEGISSMGDDPRVITLFNTKLAAGDPNVILLAAVDTKGQVKGYCAAEVQNGVALVMQPHMDEPTSNDAIAEMFDTLEDWKAERKVVKSTLVVKKLDSKWLKKYGYRIERYVLSREEDDYAA